MKAAPPAPSVTLNATQDVFIGDTFSFTAAFDNIDTTDTGYGPFIDIVLPTTGNDGAGAAQDDGISLVNVQYLGSNLDASLVHTLTFPAGAAPTCVNHPLADSGPLTPLQVCGEPGDTLLVVQLPFGSFAPNQPPAEITINAQLSNLADLGIGLDIYSRGGFMYGDDPLQNPCCDPARVSDPDTNSANWPPGGQGTITPTLVTLSKTNDGPESETATGPNFSRTYTITLDIAPGQSLNNVTITDLIDNNIVVTGISAPGSSAVNPAGVSQATPFGPVNGGQIDVTYGSINGPTSFTVTFYVPDIDANMQPVISPTSGDDVVTENFVSATASWSPLDGRDPDPTPVSITGTCPTCPPDPDDTLADKSIAIQKGVSTFPVTNPLDARPGTVLQYTLSFQVSDYFNFADIEIVDIVSDGQWLDTSFTPTFTVTDRTGTTAGSFTLQTANVAPVPACPAGTGSFDMIEDRVQIDPGDEPKVGDATDGTNGTTTLTFCVSLAMQNDGAADGIVQGGYTQGFTSGTPATGTITYRTIVQDAFTDDYPSLDQSVDHGDTLANNVTITGEIRDNADINTPLGTESDTSDAGVTLTVGTLEKSVYAIDGVTPSSNPAHIQPGSAVTYRLRYDMPSTDFEDFVITDYLPLPIFDATTITTFNAAVSAGPADSPAVGEAMYGPTDTVAAIMGTPPTITTDAVSNSVQFFYGDLDAPDNIDRTIDILFTVEVGNQPFADGLFLTNQANSAEGATNTPGHTEDAIIQVILDEPHILVKKGITGSDNPAATFDPSTTGPGSFPNINSTQLAANPVDSDVSGVDAGDTLDFAIVIENQGGNGAFDMVVTDILPAGMMVPVGGMNLSIVRGDGTSISYIPLDGGPQDTNPTSLFGNGIELVDPDSLGVCQHYSTASGSNIVIITYTLEIDPAAPPGLITNIATVEQFANTEGGPSFVDPTDPSDYSDDANIFIAPQGGKTISGTSEAYTGTAEHDTTLDDLTIGEVVTYTLTSVIPESSVLDTLTITDNLPVGMVAVSAQVISIGPNIQDGGGGTPAPTITGIGTQTVNFNFGSIRNPFNNTADDEVIMEVVARVVDVGGPNDGDTLTNSMTMTYGAANQSESVSVDIVEPDLNIAKTETGSITTGDAGDILNFRIRVTHRSASTADAFDLVITDDLAAAGLELVAVTSATTNGSGTVANTSAGNTLNITLSTLEQGRTLTILYQARIADSTLFESTLINTANLTYDSLDADGGTDERTYTDDDDYTITTNAPTFVKGISATSDSATFPELAPDRNEAGKSDVSIGERVTYRLTVTMAEGTDDIQIVDTVPATMEILSAAVTSVGGNISGAALAAGADQTDANITIDNNGGTNNRVTYNFGATVFNDPAGPVPGIAGDQIVVEFVAVVLDVGANVNNFDLVNEAAVNYTNGSVTSNQVIVEVVEPVINITKIEEASATGGEAGDLLTFRITVTHDPTSTGPAHDVRILDDLGAAGFELNAIISATTNGSGTVTNNSAGDVLDIVLDTLEVGRTFTIRYRARIPDATNFETTLTNTANMTFDSNPDEPGTPEREGTGSDTYTITTNAPTFVKGISATSDSATFPETGPDRNEAGKSDVSIGERVTYRLTVTMAEGTDDIQIVDTVPATMEILSASVVSLGGDTTIGNTSGGNISGSLLAIGADDTDANITIDNNGGTNNRVTYNFGPNVFNNPAGPVPGIAGDQIIVEFVAVVLDVGANVDDFDLVNEATVNYTNGSVTSNQVTVEVVEPDISMTKVEEGSVTLVDAGDILTFRVTVTNAATATGPAHDVRILDDLAAAGMELVSVISATGPAGSTATNNSAGNTLDVVLDTLRVGGTFTIRYRARIANSNPFGETLTNTANLTFDSNPDEPGTPEREGTDSDTYTVTTTEPDIQKGIQTTSLSDTYPGSADQNDAGVFDVAIGETITYRITVTLEEGTDEVIIVDTLPAVMQVVGAQVVSLGGDTTIGSFSGGNISGSLLAIGADETDANITIDTNVTANDRVTLNFGANVLNTPDGLTNTLDQIVVDVTGVVVDNVANTNGVDLVNDSDLNYTNGTVTSDDAVTVEVVEPVLSLTKTFAPDVVIRGDTVTMTLFVENTGTAPAYDLQIVDVLDTFLDVTNVTTAVSDATHTTATPDNTGINTGDFTTTDTVLVNVDSLWPGQSVTVTVTLFVNPALALPPPDVVVTNEASITNITTTPGTNPFERTYPDVTGQDILTITHPDVSVNKTDSIDPVVAGNQLVYTITVNNGTVPNATATNIVVTDTLPADLTVTLVQTSAGGLCQPIVGLTLTCTFASIPPAGTSTILVTGTVNPMVADGTVITNNVSVTFAERSNAVTTSEDTTVTRTLDLSLTKTVNDATPSEGDLITYTLIARNNGPADASNVTVTDTLPAGVTYVRFVPGTHPCAAAGVPVTVTCTFPTVAAGANRTIGIEVTVDPNTTGQTITNTADVTSTESGAGNVNETIQANNTDSADIFVDRVDLAVTKTVSNNTPNVGDTITYTLNIINNGPADATNVIVTDTLPGPLTFVSSNPAICTEAPADTLTCNLGDMLAGGSRTLTIRASVDTGAAGTLTNTAAVTSDQSGAGNVDEVTAANNDDTADITVGGIDLVLQKTANPTQLDEGDSTTYTITVSNTGSIAATGVVVTDTLDAGLTFVSSNPATCTPTGNPNEFGCTLTDIPPRGSRTLRITATADAGTAGQTLNNIAVVTANETEPDLTNNTDNAAVFVRQVDLAITKDVNNTTPSAPGQVIYTLTVVNHGPGDATNVVVTDVLDGTAPGLTFVSSNPAICVEAPADTLTCTIGNLRAGRNSTIRITANVDAGAAGTLTNTASVTSSESGPANANETDDTNNADNADIAVGGVNLAITKTVNDTAPDPGDTITYTLQIRNTGATNATGVTVVDTLDTTAPGLTFVSSNPAICTEAPADTLTCNVGNLAAGATTTITLDVTVDAGAAGVLTNSATVSANEPEANNTDNTDDQDVSVGVVDVAVTKVVDNPTPNTGDTVTYTVTVTNNGPSTATGVEVTESLPIDNVNLTLLNATASGTTTFTPSPPASIWNVGTLAPGQTETLLLEVRVEIPSGFITNTVTITNVNETDTDNTNDSDTALITLGGTDISVTKSVDNNIPETGDTILYTVIARNNGPNPATGVQILDALPAGVTFQTPYDATHGTYDDTTGIWDIGPLNVNEQARLRVPAVVTASGGIIINVASLDAVDQADSNSTNNTADAPIYIGAADLRLQKVMVVGGAQVGDTVQYRLTVTNQGPNQATGVQVTDTMPAGVTYTSATSSQGTFTPAPSATILWNVGALNVGQSATLTIDGQLNSITASKLNTAEVTASNQPDPDSTPNNGDTTEDDYAEAESPGIFDPPYGLKVFDDSGLPELEWALIWVNPSNVPATNVEVFDDIPAGTTYKAGSLVCSSPGASTTTLCEYDAANNRIHWQGTLAPDPGATTVAQANNQLIIRFRVIVDNQVRRVQNQATLQTPAGMSITSNLAVWEAPSDGSAAPDLKLAKSVEPPFAGPGDTVVWTIPVLNDGVNVLDHVRVTDVIDLELEILDISATRGTISMTGREVIVEINQLQPGEQVIITITTRVSPSASTPFIILNTVYARDKYAEAILVSAEALPATGETPPWRIPLIAGMGTLLIIGTVYTGHKLRKR